MSIDLEESEAILDTAGRVIKKSSSLNAENWKTIAGAVFIVCMLLGSAVLAIGWTSARSELQSLKRADSYAQNAIDIQNSRIDKLETAIVRVDANLMWIRDYVQGNIPNRSRDLAKQNDTQKKDNTSQTP